MQFNMHFHWIPVVGVYWDENRLLEKMRNNEGNHHLIVELLDKNLFQIENWVLMTWDEWWKLKREDDEGEEQSREKIWWGMALFDFSIRKEGRLLIRLSLLLVSLTIILQFSLEFYVHILRLLYLQNILLERVKCYDKLGVYEGDDKW